MVDYDIAVGIGDTGDRDGSELDIDASREAAVSLIEVAADIQGPRLQVGSVR
jgi:hypothetical protein